MDNWHIIETKFEPEKQHTQETIFTIGNGYLGTRGAFEEGYPGELASTLVHGVFDHAPIVHSELANTPNWLGLHLFANGERFHIDPTNILSYQRVLDLSDGVLTRQVRWQLSIGQQLEVTFQRFASLADEHILCLRCKVNSIGFSGKLEFRAGLYGHVDNNGLVHWDWVGQGSAAPQRSYIELLTRGSKVILAEACHLGITGGSNPSYDYWDSLWSPELLGRVEIQPGEEVIADKITCIYTSRDIQDPKDASIQKLNQASSLGYSVLRAANHLAWEKEWEQCNITIEGDDDVDLALRFNIYQLLIAAPRCDNRVSIAAKSLSGYGYRGHVFWDTEIFILPFFTYIFPEIARNLLMYRYHTLPKAREKARLLNYEGAMFPWESAATGEENTPRWVPGPDGKDLVRIWTGDIEHHISADIAYAAYQYWQVTGDDGFMQEYGAEMILDTARFWGSRAEWNAGLNRYEMNNVIGPDEYHEHVDNNVYTNGMAHWCLVTAFQVLDWLEKTAPEKAAQLKASLDLTPGRLSHWREVIDKLFVNYQADTRLFEQFDGYFKRKDINLEEYEPRRRSMQALLGIEPTQEYQVVKQPDVLMLLYLLQADYDRQVLEANFDYYTPRTDLSYGSSLGPAIQALLTSRLGDSETAYQLFKRAAFIDLDDNRGNTPDGIHAATTGGLWQACVFGFAGLGINGNVPFTQPHLPARWKRLKFCIRYHNSPFEFDIRQDDRDPSEIPHLPIRGAIFDLDGVLTDTSELHYQAWKRLADEEHIPFNCQDNDALRGVSRRDSLLILLKDSHRSEEELQRMMQTKNDYYLESIRNLTPANLFPGSRQFLEDVRKSGVKIAVGSASKNAREVIEKLGMEDPVDAISDGYSVQRQKPAPDLFLHAANQLGISPSQCVVFEDAEAGVQAALAGGMWAVGIGPVERVGSANVVISGLADSCWACVLDQLQQTQVFFYPQSSSITKEPEFTRKGDHENIKNRPI